MEFRSYPMYKLRSKYFRFRGRHLGLPASGLVGQHSGYLHWLAEPQKYEVSRWYFVPVSSDFRLPVYVAQHSDYFHRVAGPRKHGCSRWNFVPIASTSWDLSTSGLEAAILDFLLPVWSNSIQATCIDLLKKALEYSRRDTLKPIWQDFSALNFDICGLQAS